jgi:hypothetical protein
MSQELASQNDPLDANLEKVIPSLHEWHRINKNEMFHLKESVSTIDGKLSEMQQKIDGGLQDVKRVLLSNNERAKQELAASFLQIAKYLIRDASGQSTDSPTSPTLARIVGGPSRMTLDELPEDGHPPAQDSEEYNEGSPNSETPIATFRMKPKHLILLELLHEWYGVGDYDDGFGGIQGRNENHKEWKKLCGRSFNQGHYSRTERTVKAVLEYGRLNNIDVFLAADRLQLLWVENKCSVSNFVIWAQQNHFLEKKGARGRAKAALLATRTPNGMDESD